MDIKDKVMEIISESSQLKNISESTKILDLKIDSLDLMEIVMSIEAEIGGELSDEVISNLKNKTIGDVIIEFKKVANK